MTTKELASRILNQAIRDRDAGNGFNTAFAEAGIEQFIQQAITAAVEAEREACAKIADEEGVVFMEEDSIAERIRARCNKSATEINNT